MAEPDDEYDPSDDERLVRLHDRTWPGAVGWKNPFPPTEEHRRLFRSEPTAAPSWTRG